MKREGTTCAAPVQTRLALALRPQPAACPNSARACAARTLQRGVDKPARRRRGARGVSTVCRVALHASSAARLLRRAADRCAPGARSWRARWRCHTSRACRSSCRSWSATAMLPGAGWRRRSRIPRTLAACQAAGVPRPAAVPCLHGARQAAPVSDTLLRHGLPFGTNLARMPTHTKGPHVLRAALRHWQACVPRQPDAAHALHRAWFQ
jgi:hypothetical protein